jgi:hypothetical protein
MNVLFGDGPIAWRLVRDDAVWATVFGAAAAAGSILLARRADARSAGADHGRVDETPSLDALSEGAAHEMPTAPRERSSAR